MALRHTCMCASHAAVADWLPTVLGASAGAGACAESVPPVITTATVCKGGLHGLVLARGMRIQHQCA